MSTTIYYKAFSSGTILSKFGPATLMVPYTAWIPADYGFVFSNIDGTVSENETVVPTDTTATFWLLPPGKGSGSAVGLYGFDATLDVTVPIKFSVTPPVANETSFPVGPGGATVVAPEHDGVTQAAGYGPGTFQSWFDVRHHSSSTSNTLTLPQDAGGVFLAVYSATPPPPVDCATLVSTLQKWASQGATLSQARASEYRLQLFTCFSEGKITWQEFNLGNAAIDEMTPPRLRT